MIKTCICGNEFVTDTTRKLCPDCAPDRDEWVVSTVKCRMCGKTFDTDNPRAAFYCSEDCRKKALYYAKAKKPRQLLKKDTVLSEGVCYYYLDEEGDEVPVSSRVVSFLSRQGLSLEQMEGESLMKIYHTTAGVGINTLQALHALLSMYDIQHRF